MDRIRTKKFRCGRKMFRFDRNWSAERRLFGRRGFEVLFWEKYILPQKLIEVKGDSKNLKFDEDIPENRIEYKSK